MACKGERVVDLYVISIIFGILGLWQTKVASDKTYKAGDGSAGMFNAFWASMFWFTFGVLTIVQLVQHAIK